MPQYLISGSSYTPGLLAGKTHLDVATAMQDPSTDVAKGAVGAANAITAAICQTTKNQPANVCTTKVISDLQRELAAGATTASP